jgi:KipI family sensor histidine kinase inhibitor
MSAMRHPPGRVQRAQRRCDVVARMQALRSDHVPMISLLGTTGLLFEPPGDLDLHVQRRIWWLARQVETWPSIKEAVPGMNNLMLVFGSPPRDVLALETELLSAWSEAEELHLEGRIVELPVVYGGEHGPHIADVTAHTGLSIEEVVRIHTEPLYTVFALGSHPGYCYLGGMDRRIATPRRKVPVLRLPGGAVSIGGSQTGVSASEGPSGWNTIGHTDMRFFDPQRDPPAVLAPGDMIRFRAERIVE